MKTLFLIMMFGFLFSCKGEHEKTIAARSWPKEKIFFLQFAEIFLLAFLGAGLGALAGSLDGLRPGSFFALASPFLLASILLRRSPLFYWSGVILAIFLSDDFAAPWIFAGKLAIITAAILVAERLFLAIQLRLKMSPPLASVRGLPALFLTATVLTIFLGGLIRALTYVF